jgi:hypothetical protein
MSPSLACRVIRKTGWLLRTNVARAKKVKAPTVGRGLQRFNRNRVWPALAGGPRQVHLYFTLILTDSASTPAC